MPERSGSSSATAVPASSSWVPSADTWASKRTSSTARLAWTIGVAREGVRRRSNCVIVATSTLELGLDVGDLDRIIQIDAPFSVASFLQRLGRTGRRVKGSVATRSSWPPTTRASSVPARSRVFGEMATSSRPAPALPYHVCAAAPRLVLQEGRIGPAPLARVDRIDACVCSDERSRSGGGARSPGCRRLALSRTKVCSQSARRRSEASAGATSWSSRES